MIYSFLESLTINGSKFINNSANEGGSLYIVGGILNIFNSKFIYNRANIGGAIYLNKVTNFIVSTVTFKKNFA